MILFKTKRDIVKYFLNYNYLFLLYGTLGTYIKHHHCVVDKIKSGINYY